MELYIVNQILSQDRIYILGLPLTLFNKNKQTCFIVSFILPRTSGVLLINALNVIFLKPHGSLWLQRMCKYTSPSTSPGKCLVALVAKYLFFWSFSAYNIFYITPSFSHQGPFWSAWIITPRWHYRIQQKGYFFIPMSLQTMTTLSRCDAVKPLSDICIVGPILSLPLYCYN